MQGKTIKATILSLNSRTGMSKKIYPVSLPSIYVGCSRVYDHNFLRILPLSHEDKEVLKKLKWDPYLPMFFKNWDESGKWKANGLKEKRQEFVRAVKIKLGIIELDSLTCTEAKEFVRQLDVIVTSKNNNPTIYEYQKALEEAHAEGRSMLNANDGTLLRRHQAVMKK